MEAELQGIEVQTNRKLSLFFGGYINVLKKSFYWEVMVTRSDTGTTTSHNWRLSFVRRFVGRHAQCAHAVGHVYAVSDRGVLVHVICGQHSRPDTVNHSGDQELRRPDRPTDQVQRAEHQIHLLILERNVIMWFRHAWSKSRDDVVGINPSPRHFHFFLYVLSRRFVALGNASHTRVKCVRRPGSFSISIDCCS